MKWKYLNPLEWFRFIPHPKYGYYGGGKNFCEEEGCPLPLDGADFEFRKHDTALKIAAQEKNFFKRARERYLADRRLGRGLWKTKLKELHFNNKQYEKTLKGRWESLKDRAYIPAARVIFFRP